MDEYSLSLLIFSLCLFLIFLGFLIWGIISGQFTDIEEPKYRMLELLGAGENKSGNQNSENNHKEE